MTTQLQQQPPQTQPQPVTRICPRCRRAYNDVPALSRLDNTTAICPECGHNEAFEQLARVTMSTEATRDLLEGRSNGSNGQNPKETKKIPVVPDPDVQIPLHVHSFHVIFSPSGLIVLKFCACGLCFRMEAIHHHFNSAWFWVPIHEGKWQGENK